MSADPATAPYHLYTAPTPNGYKVSVALEELGLPYDVTIIDLVAGEQKHPEFLALNPNGKIPVLIDREAGDFPIMESGAILLWLAEKCGQLLPTDPKARSLTLQWLMFQMGGLGPMMGQANVFHRYFPERIEPVIDRYQRESLRLLTVLDAQLARHPFLAGDEFTIADIANWTWARGHEWSGVSIDDLPHLQRWLAKLESRPGCARGVQVPFDAVARRREEAADFARAGQAVIS
jgi:glutathione S-transferase/GST-like protein